jgi:glycosyltransferase involved in cell wall biosynthesis
MWRSFRSRHHLRLVRDRTPQFDPNAVVCVICVRNEDMRLPYFFEYYRKMGVDHFFVVDNDSTDGTLPFLAAQEDVSVWSTTASYKAARFGLDWTTWLQMKYARKRWCLTLDADELLVFPQCETRTIQDLTKHLDDIGQKAFGALMLDLYPKGPIDRTTYTAGDNPVDALEWFDAEPYRAKRQAFKDNLWVQGGVRERVFFANNVEKGPTLNKLPLVKWDMRYTYVNSTHSMLPAKMNKLYDGPGDDRLCGVLLHTKFLHIAVEKSSEEKKRKQHFGSPDAFEDYYDSIIAAPDLWTPSSTKLQDSGQLLDLGLMCKGGWE